MFQLVEVDEKCSSWFIGNFVIEGISKDLVYIDQFGPFFVSDGSYYTLVPIDPLFLAIPPLLKAKQVDLSILTLVFMFD